MRSISLAGALAAGVALLSGCLLSGCVAVTDFERDPPDALPPPVDAVVGDAYQVPQADAFPVSGLQELDPPTTAECAQICEQLEACAFDDTLDDSWICDPHPDNQAFGVNACVGICANNLRLFQTVTLARCRALQAADNDGAGDLMRSVFCIEESLCGVLCFDGQIGQDSPIEACTGFRVTRCPQTCRMLPDQFWACVAQDVYLTLWQVIRENPPETPVDADFSTLLCEHVAICLPE